MIIGERATYTFAFKFAVDWKKTRYTRAFGLPYLLRLRVKLDWFAQIAIVYHRVEIVRGELLRTRLLADREKSMQTRCKVAKSIKNAIYTDIRKNRNEPVVAVSAINLGELSSSGTTTAKGKRRTINAMFK